MPREAVTARTHDPIAPSAVMRIRSVRRTSWPSFTRHHGQDSEVVDPGAVTVGLRFSSHLRDDQVDIPCDLPQADDQASREPRGHGVHVRVAATFSGPFVIEELLRVPAPAQPVRLRAAARARGHDHELPAGGAQPAGQGISAQSRSPGVGHAQPRRGPDRKPSAPQDSQLAALTRPAATGRETSRASGNSARPLVATGRARPFRYAPEMPSL
jgi:hypothetical protein